MIDKLNYNATFFEKMNIYIDLSVLLDTEFITGIQRVTLKFVLGIIDRYANAVNLLKFDKKKNRYIVLNNLEFFKCYSNRSSEKCNMYTKEYVYVKDLGDGDIWFDIDAVWMGDVRRSYLLPLIKKQGCKILVQVYDIIPISHPQFCHDRTVYLFSDYISAHIKFSDRIIVNANATKNSIKKLADKCGINMPECNVIPLGADFSTDTVIRSEELDERVKEISEIGKYVLMVGTLEPRKNHKLVLDAFEGNGFKTSDSKSLKEQGFNLVIAGRIGWNMEEFVETLRNLPEYNKRIFHLEKASDKELIHLYQNASYLIFASYEEGFGLPIIEALVRGARVVCADVPVLREVGGEYCIWFKQGEAEDLARKVCAAETGKLEPNKMVKRDGFEYFRWNEVVERVIDALDEMMSS